MPTSVINKIIEAFRANSLDPKIGLHSLRSQFNSLALAFKPSPDAIYEDVTISLPSASTDSGVSSTVPLHATWVDVLEAAQSKVLIYLHGGGYIAGSSAMYSDFAARLASAVGTRVLLIDYRLAPENPYPAALEDTLNAYLWLLNKEYEPQDILFAGDGAGGGLVVATLLRLRSLALQMPLAAALISPWTDLSLTAKSLKSKAAVDPVLSYELLKFAADLYIGAVSDHCNIDVSPFYADLTGLPPLTIMVAADEVLADDANRFANKAEFFGVETAFVVAKEMIHSWPFFAPILPEGQQAVEFIGQSLNKFLTIL